MGLARLLLTPRHCVDGGDHLSTGRCEPLVPTWRRYLGFVFFSYCLSWKIGNKHQWRAVACVPTCLPGFHGGGRVAHRPPSERSLLSVDQAQPRPGALFLDVQKPFFPVKASRSLLPCSFFHGLMVEDSLFPPRPAPSPAPTPGDPAGLAVMGGCRPRLAVAPCRPRGFGRQLSPGLRAPSDPRGAVG